MERKAARPTSLYAGAFAFYWIAERANDLPRFHISQYAGLLKSLLSRPAVDQLRACRRKETTRKIREYFIIGRTIQFPGDAPLLITTTR